VLFRSLRSLAGRTLAAGDGGGGTLTLFNAAQPSLVGVPAKIHPGTLETVKVAPAWHHQPMKRRKLTLGAAPLGLLIKTTSTRVCGSLREAMTVCAGRPG
jgi:hypothetical protein